MTYFKDHLAGNNGHYRYYQLETFFKKLHEQGIKFAELWLGPMHFYVDSSGHDEIDQLFILQKKYDVKIIGICPQQTNPNPFNIATKNQQEKVLQYYKNVFEVASQIKCSQVLVTSGWAFLDEDIRDARKRSITMMKKLAEMAKSYNITLVMEALQPEESILVNTIRQLHDYLEAVHASNLKVCIDLGAMARVNETLDAYFKTFGSNIKHIHFVDGSPSGHLAWGDGNRCLYDDVEVLKKYGYQGYLSLEMAASRYFQNPWESEQTTLRSWDNMQGDNV